MKSKDNKASASMPKHLELNEDGVRLVSLTFGVTLYTNKLFSKIPDSVLGCYDKVLQLCSQDNFHYYATTNMRKHKPVTKRTFGMLEKWLSEDASLMEYIGLELKDGEVYQDAATFKFRVFAGEKGSAMFEDKDANLISMSFPARWGLERAEEMLAFVNEVCSIFPFQSGHAGFSFECSRYETETSQTHAWSKSMRFRGIDISRVPEDALAVGQDALKSVGWLTILSKPFIKRLGGLNKFRKSLPNEFQFIDVPGGIIFRAGLVPAFGDINRGDNLPLYKKIFHLIAPLVDVASKRSQSFDLDTDDFVEKTEEWYRRLSHE
jgi:hypothetical protein